MKTAPPGPATLSTAKTAFKPSQIQSYPFCDPDFNEAIELMTKGLHFLKGQDHDEAKGHFEQARDFFEAVTKKDYSVLIKIIPPDAGKRQESLKKAEATKIAAKANFDRCKTQIEACSLPLKLKTGETNTKLEAGILASIFGKEGLSDDSYKSDIERVFRELGIVEDDTYREALIASAKALTEAIERSEVIVIPDDVLTLSDHGINNPSLKLHDKTVQEWKDELIKKLQQPEEPQEKRPSGKRDRRATNKLALSIVTSDGKPLGTVTTQLIDPRNKGDQPAIDLPPIPSTTATRPPAQPKGIHTSLATGGLNGEAGNIFSPSVFGDGMGDQPRNLFEAAQQIPERERPFIGASAIGDPEPDYDEPLPPKPENPLATLLGEMYIVTAVKKEEASKPKAILTKELVEAELERHSIPKDDQAFYLIKALVSDCVVTTEAELRTIALITSRNDLATAARNRHFTNEEFTEEIINVLTGFSAIKNLSTAQWGKIFCEYIESDYSQKFRDWYDRYHTENIRSTTEAALGLKISGTLSKKSIGASDLPNVTVRIFQLLDLAFQEGVITETERKVVKTLLYNYEEFQAFFLQIETKKDQGKINAKISEIAHKIERNYCGLGAKVRLHVIENGQHKAHAAPLYSACLGNAITWLDLKNDYFQTYLDNNFPEQRGILFDIKPAPIAVTTQAAFIDSASPSPVVLKQITLDDWKNKSVIFSHERPNGTKFLIAYFGLLAKGQLPTVEKICTNTGFSKNGFDDFKKEHLDTEFAQEGYLPLSLFDESQAEISEIYLSYRKFKKEHETEEFTLEKLCETLSSRDKNQLCSDVKERDFSKIILIDPSFSEVLTYLQIEVDDYERKEASAREDAELIRLIDAEAQAGQITEVTEDAPKEEKPTVSSFHLDKIREAVESTNENGKPLTIDELLKRFNTLPLETKYRLLRSYTIIDSERFPVKLKYSDGRVEEGTMDKNQYRELENQVS